MVTLHQDPEFDAQLGRTIIAAHCEAGDIGEAIAVGGTVAPGDHAGWFDAWARAAERAGERGEAALAGGHRATARQAFLRASEYWRQAIFFVRSDLDDERLQRGWRAHRAAFRQAVPLMAHEVVTAEIPFPRGGSMTTYLCRAHGAGDAPRPVVVMPCGYDSTAEAGYVATGYMALRRGMDALLFEGPGQGGMLYEHRVPMAPDFEAALAPVLDWLLARPDVDPARVSMIGRSFAGYLAPRAAAEDHRVRALVCDPGQFDFVSRMVPGQIDEATWQRVLAADPEVDARLEAMRAGPGKAEWWGARMATMGATSVGDFLRMQPGYTLEGRAERIACPTLVTEGEGDFASQGRELMDHLTCEKRFVAFSAAEGAGGHCEGLGAALFEGRVFDWLQEVLPGPA